MKTEVSLCKCNKCDSLMIDYNCQVDAPKYFVNVEILPELQYNSSDGSWECPFCGTDGYLSDYFTIDDLKEINADFEVITEDGENQLATGTFNDCQEFVEDYNKNNSGTEIMISPLTAI